MSVRVYVRSERINVCVCEFVCQRFLFAMGERETVREKNCSEDSVGVESRPVHTKSKTHKKYSAHRSHSITSLLAWQNFPELLFIVRGTVWCSFVGPRLDFASLSPLTSTLNSHRSLASDRTLLLVV